MRKSARIGAQLKTGVPERVSGVRDPSSSASLLLLAASPTQQIARHRFPACSSCSLGIVDPARRVSLSRLTQGSAQRCWVRPPSPAFAPLPVRQPAAWRPTRSAQCPPTTVPALASWALDKPQKTLGLRRINSTRKRAIPLSSRYSPTMAPVPCRLPPRHHSQPPISRPGSQSRRAAWDAPARTAESAQCHWGSSCPRAVWSESRSSRRRRESSRCARCRSRWRRPARPGPASAARRSSPTSPETPALRCQTAAPPYQAKPAVSHSTRQPILAKLGRRVQDVPQLGAHNAQPPRQRPPCPRHRR